MVDTILFWFALGVLLSVAELANPQRRDRRRTDRRQLSTDAAWLVLYLLYAPVLGTVITVIGEALSSRTPAWHLVAGIPVAAQMLLVVFIAEVVAYWIHRFEHTRPALWRIHSVHHSSESLRWWSAFRFHPLDTALSRGVPLIVVSLCGISLQASIAYLVVVAVVTLFAHADVHLPAGFVQRVVVTPAFHRTHHERGREMTNYALVLPVLDRAFGSESPSSGHSFGCDGTVPRRGVVAQLAWGIGFGGSTNDRSAEGE